MSVVAPAVDVRDWRRRYPPLVVILAAATLALTTLPSSLTLPQQNPSQTTEYAPVPGDQGQAPPGGAFAGLGLGGGSSLTAGAGEPPSPLPPLPGAPGGSLPAPKSCIGNPPRQTEDPLSPPCVPRFTGDNHGATYQGVTGNRITILYYFQLIGGNCYAAGSSVGCQEPPPTGYYDMDKPQDVNAFSAEFRWVHDWEVYFNSRYQTYNRYAHVIVYVDTEDAATAVQNLDDQHAAADAAKNFADIHPFAILTPVPPLVISPGPYADYMAQHGVLDFGGEGNLKLASTYQKYAGLVWGFPPTIDIYAQLYSSFVCQKFKGGVTTFAGAKPGNGVPRKFGLLQTTDPGAPEIRTAGNLIRSQLDACGISYVPHTFPYTGSANSTGPDSPGYATKNMNDFMLNGVTTILAVGGQESGDQKAASAMRYYPEWVALGDGALDGNLGGSAEPADVWDHAVVITYQILQNADGQPVERACYEALTSVDPTVDRQALDIAVACGFFFDDIRELFIGIQLAGPVLTPRNMDKGFHAIPPKLSHSPDQPSCFYNPGDYTCVKDGVMMWWDSTAHPQGNGGSSATNGCYRMWQDGLRYIGGQWPSGDPKTPGQGWNSNNICNLYLGGAATAVRTD